MFSNRLPCVMYPCYGEGGQRGWKYHTCLWEFPSHKACTDGYKTPQDQVLNCMMDMQDYFMPSPQLFITSGQNILKMQAGSHHFPVSSVFPWFLSKGDVNCPLAAWASFTSVPWLVSIPSPGEASISVPTCVPAHVLSQSVWTFCSLCLDSWPQPIFPSGFLLKCHFFLTTRCLVGSCTFPLAVLLTFELTCFVWLSMRPQSFLLFGHLQEHQGSSRVHLLPCCLQHRAPEPET